MMLKIALFGAGLALAGPAETGPSPVARLLAADPVSWAQTTKAAAALNQPDLGPDLTGISLRAAVEQSRAPGAPVLTPTMLAAALIAQPERIAALEPVLPKETIANLRTAASRWRGVAAKDESAMRLLEQAGGIKLDEATLVSSARWTRIFDDAYGYWKDRDDVVIEREPPGYNRGLYTEDWRDKWERDQTAWLPKPGDPARPDVVIKPVDSREVSKELQTLKGYRFVFVPGILNEIHRFLGSLPPFRWLGLNQYFGDQIDWLRAHGVEAERLEVRSLPSARNAATIQEAVQASDKPVILVTHSKGGLDALAALLGSAPLRQKVAGWISLQAPFFGTPLADFLAGSRPLRWALGLFARAIGGSLEPLDEMTTAARAAYQEKNKAAIAALTKSMPIISVAGFKRESRFLANTILGLPRDWMERKGSSNDGSVTVGTSILPGTNVALFSGVDHLVTVMKAFIAGFNRVRFQKILLSLLVPELKAAQPSGAKPSSS